ncbi:serine/threonine protein kinase, putative [Plasmodium malariae]|uniref:Serine/threonine protein kinase, putative n=3 Tax=Plasmodium malariae TaxID=5858 RepID=A0A1D3SQE4_PLAMA|nr:serine/threonine protein kinase, putative [Plasmodium malariae]SCO94127.1 serine/threonine protein kinase, putative [Plasmodium malariae]
MEQEKMINRDKTSFSEENILNDIHYLTMMKNINIDIIQEGLLKNAIDDDDTNSIQFLEDDNCSKSELTILNARFKVEETNYTSNKHELRYADINITIDFNKKQFAYSIDNSKIHKCYYLKITVLLDYIIEEGLSFKESILYLHNSINDSNSMNCACWGNDKSAKNDKSNRKKQGDITEKSDKHEKSENNEGPYLEYKQSDNSKIEPFDIKDDTVHKGVDKLKVYINLYEQGDIIFLDKKKEMDELRRVTSPTYFDDNIIFLDNENDKLGQNELLESVNSKIEHNVVVKQGHTDIAFLKEEEERKRKEKRKSEELKKNHKDEQKEEKEEKEERDERENNNYNDVREDKDDVYYTDKDYDDYINDNDDKDYIDDYYYNDHVDNDDYNIDNIKEESKSYKKEGYNERGEKAFSLKDAEEISLFLKSDFRNNEFEKDNPRMKGRDRKYEVEEEKKKKAFTKIMNENTPVTVLLSEKGNEVCKELINNHSRYYRDFKEEKVLGCGGFGYVMKVKNKRFDITYALKKIRLSSYSNGSTFLNTNDDVMDEDDNYIVEEAIMFSKLQHENIVRYYDAWIEKNIDFYLCKEIKHYSEENIKKTKKEYIDFMEEIKQTWNCKKSYEEKSKEKYLYILMEYCPGKTLREAIDCGFIYENEKLIWELIKQILKGLYFIHDMKKMHRDIKPSNIFLQISDDILTAKIGDFGLTTQVGNNKINPSAGTVNYISPEQLKGEYFDQKADIFSLGVVFFEMFHKPFSTIMERSIVLSNLLKGIYPEYMQSESKRFQFLSSLLAINPKERSSAYKLLHDYFFFSFEKDYTEIYNLVEKKRNCEEVHTIISALFNKFDTKREEKIIKKEDMLTFQSAKMFTEESDIRKSIKKKIIASLKSRGAIFIITPIVLRNKYYINLENIYIDECNCSQHSYKKKECKTTNIYINTNICNNVVNLVYLLDIYGNTVTLRPSFFLSFSEYIYENINCYSKNNETSFYLKFYTEGYTYKYHTIKSKQTKKDINTQIYPEEVEKIFYCILINSKNLYGKEELNYHSIFSNSDILVSVYTLYNHLPHFNKLLFLWSYIDLLPLILNVCLDISQSDCDELSLILKKNTSLLVSKSSITPLVQQFKMCSNSGNSNSSSNNNINSSGNNNSNGNSNNNSSSNNNNNNNNNNNSSGNSNSNNNNNSSGNINSNNNNNSSGSNNININNNNINNNNINNNNISNNNISNNNISNNNISNNNISNNNISNNNISNNNISNNNISNNNISNNNISNNNISNNNISNNNISNNNISNNNINNNNSNASKISDFIYSLFQLKCENNKVDEYLNSLSKFISDILNKKDPFFSGYNKNSLLPGMENANAYYSGNSSAIGGPTDGPTGSPAGDPIGSSFGNDIDTRSNYVIRCKSKKKNETLIKYTGTDAHENEANKMNIFSVLDKVRKINNFIGTNTIIDNTCFDLFLNYEENIFSNEIIFYVINEGKNKDIIAYGGRFDRIMQKLNRANVRCDSANGCGNVGDSNNIWGDYAYGSSIVEGSNNVQGNSNLEGGNANGSSNVEDGHIGGFGSSSSGNTNTLNIKAYGVEIYVDKIFLKVTECSEKMFNMPLIGTSDKSQIFKNFLLTPHDHNNFACTNNIIHSSFNNGPLNYSSPKVLIEVYEIENLLVAYDLSRNLLSNNIPSYTYFSSNTAHNKKKAKRFKQQKIKFIISIKSNSNDASFDMLNSVKLNDVIYKIFNSNNEDYNFLRQEELIHYLTKNM